MLFLFFVVLYCVFAIEVGCLNIGLHAQVDPKDKVVGSAITTNGIKAAFLLREHEKNYVQTFYPMNYPGINSVQWDLIIIEGWFPSIDNFIKLIRLYSPNAIVLFYCLDQLYPGLGVISKLDVDGYLTNSLLIQSYLNEETNIPTQYLLLAADAEIMKPKSIDNIRNKFSVYVGAGGHMLPYKPTLLPTLLEFLPHGLEIYGSYWDSVPQVSNAYKGKLPENSLAQVYTDSTIVVSSIIKTQEDVGMINNRVFEGLACGAILVSEYSDSLHKIVKASKHMDFIYFYRNTSDISSIIADIRSSSPSKLQLASLHAREFIIEKHTWSHRVIEILDFYYHIKSTSELVKASSRANNRLLAYTTSNHLLTNSDAAYLQVTIIPLLSNSYTIHQYSESEWTLVASNDTLIKQYDTVVIVATPFDALDVYTRQLAPITRQSRMLYVLGVDASLLPREPLTPIHQQYDCIWFRDFYEMKLLTKFNLGSELRLQHVYGNNLQVIPEPNTALLSMDIGTSNRITLQKENIVFCYYHSINYCSARLRQDIVGNSSEYTLVLIGGNSFSSWLDVISTVSYIDLPNTYHVADGRTSFATFVYAPTIDSMYIFNVPDIEPVDTTNNIIWPLVNSLSSRASYYNLDQIKFFFYSKSEHYISVVNADGGCRLWDNNYLKNSYVLGDIRLHHLGSCRSSLNLVLSDEIKLPQEIVYFNISVSDFSVGIDGKVCIEYNSNVFRCIMQPTSKMSITFSHDNDFVKNKEIILTFFLQSIVVQDKIDVINCRFLVSSSSSDRKVQISSVDCDKKYGNFTAYVMDDLTSIYGVHDVLVEL